jgi:ubiquinone/menaquinone biosynthesis C-methylase UbiE
MDPNEYTNLERIEAEHWYYAGKRDVVKGWIVRARKPVRTDRLLDCGAGTGRFAKEMEEHCQVLVLDDHEESLSLLRTRFRAEQILRLVRGNVPLANQSVEILTALDVLEHVPDDHAVVKDFYRVIKTGGIAVVTVPATMALWSDWDVALHHYRRYSRAQLAELFPLEHWEIVYLNYTNVIVFPLVWLIRKWRALLLATGHRVRSRSEDSIPPKWLNKILRSTFVAMAQWPVRFPFGVSLLLVARRRP